MGEIRDNRTFRLFAIPNFWTGVGRILDLTGKLNTYNTSDSENFADTKAIESDWYMIGEDFKDTYEKVSENGCKEKPKKK